jgi:hypothetical protein
VAPRTAGDSLADVAWRDLRQLLDDELARLPERLRAPLVLCYLEGHTRDEAAQQLGWSLATLKRRLERGRAILHDRLTRRGLAPAVSLLAAALAPPAVPAALARATLDAAQAFVTTGAIAAPVAALVQAGLGTGDGAKLRMALLCLLAGTLLAADVGGPSGPGERPSTEPRLTTRPDTPPNLARP